MSTYCFISKLRKGAGFSTCSALPMLSVLSGVLIALQLLLSSVAYASPTASGYTFGNKQPLDQASVSVVRLVVTYTATAAIPPAPACTTTSTGLGVLVGSWPTTAGSSTDFTNWAMTDGTLVNPQGISCGTGKPMEALSTIQLYVNDAYTSATGNLTSSPLLKTLTCMLTGCTDGTVSAPITCQISTPCSKGIVLVPFHTTAPQPFIDVATATADQNLSTAQAPFGVGLASPTPSTITPTPAQATQLLTPFPVINTAAPKNELGMPIVNDIGQLLDMNTKALDTGGSIRSFVTTQLSPGPVGQAGHTNSLRDSWNQGITDYYGGNYVNAQTDFRNAGTHNTLFRAGVAFWNLATAKAGNGGTGANGSGSKTPTPTKTPGSNSTPAHNGVTILGHSISDSLLTVLVIGALVLLIIILALITFAVVRRQARQRKEFAELDRRADVDAAQIAQKEKEESLRTQQGRNFPQSFNPVNAAPPMQPQAPPLQPQAQSVPNLRCPNCGTLVNQTDNFCPNCRSPISLTDSGLNVRLNKPPISSPLPVVSQASPVAGLVPSVAFSDMPTEEIPFGTVGAAQNGNEKTTPLIVRNSTPRSAPPVEQFSGHKLGLIVGTQSDPGIKRKHKPNEDSIFAAEGMLNSNVQAPAFGLFVVADGMGGHANGQDASRLAIKTIVETLMPRLTSNEPFTDDAFAQLLADGVQQANMAVHQRNLEHRADMGTTMTATLIIGTNAYMANVGDSRTYLYRQPEGLKKVTNDHSVVASLVDAGIIKPDDIYTHPKRNQIYRSLGEKPVVDVDTFKVPLQPGDKIILCSDGLWDMVRDPIIEQVLNTVPDPTQTRHALIQAALDGGGEDNVSVIVVHIANSPQGAGLSGVQVLAQPEAPQYPPM
ncbi:MAG: PP2C family serine/threonine-protein phosphatase [Ktedonobacteraceae bacterium]